MSDDIDIVRLQMRADALEREVDDLKTAVKDMTSGLTSVSTELKLAVQELRGAATQPFNRLQDGWRVLAGLGALVFAIVIAASAVVNILDHFKHTH